MPEMWGNKTPREWQAKALPKALDAFGQDVRGVVRAATGSGKSILQAEIVNRILPDIPSDQFVLITAPTQKLVRQLAITINERNPRRVGRFYQNEKRADASVVVACHASIGELGKAITQLNRRPYCWIADECHKTESDLILNFAGDFEPKKLIGFTATPFRRKEKETLSLFEELVFDYGPQDAIRDGVIVMPRVVPYEGVSENIDEVCAEWIAENKHLGPGIVNAWNCDDCDAYAEYLSNFGIKAASIHSKQKDKRQARLIQMLENGSLDALVHVNMLTEGVDLPWLRWLCMRRASESRRGKGNLRVISRVRFIQEVGRIVRAYPGKTEAIIFDPNDLFGTLALDYDALLGETEEEETDDQTAQAAQMVLRNVDLSGTIEDQRLQVIENRSPIQQYVRQVALTFRLLGFSALKSKGTKWRHYPATNRQKTITESLMKDVAPFVDVMPQEHRSSLRAACIAHRQGQLNQGDMFDLNTIMRVMKKQSGWPAVTTE